MNSSEKVRLLFVQFAGDYREAFQRLTAGGKETYRAQKYTVDAVTEIARKTEKTAVLCYTTQKYYHERLGNGVYAIGAGLDESIFQKKVSKREIIKFIEEQNPTHLVVRTPMRGIFEWAIQNKVSTLAILADSFSSPNLRSRVRNYLLARLLNHRQIHWVSNHGINACKSLQNIGVISSKIIPFDYPYSINPNLFPPKYFSDHNKPFVLIYVGSIFESKGVGDILESVAILKAKNLQIQLKIAGRGEIDFFSNQAKKLQIDDCVEFLGLVPNDSVVNLMQEADTVIVPSRHEYPEGMPLTIYEALCSRTPIIASNHPMFEKILRPGIDALVFPAGNSQALAECIEKLMFDSDLYQSLSVTSSVAWKRLQIPVKWADLIERWLDNSPENQQWLFEHRLSSERYK